MDVRSWMEGKLWRDNKASLGQCSQTKGNQTELITLVLSVLTKDDTLLLMAKITLGDKPSLDSVQPKVPEQPEQTPWELLGQFSQSLMDL